MSAASVSTEAMTGVRACSLPDSCGVQEPGAGWVDQLADVITRRITEKVFPARRGSVPFHTSLRRFVRTNVLSVANAHDAVCPPCEEPQRSVQEFGVWVAEQGFPLTAVQNAYWTGTRQLIDVWGEMGWPGLAPLRHVDDDPTNVPGHVVSQVAATTFEFAEHAMRASVTAYQEATASLRLDGAQRRRTVVETILAAGESRPDPAWDTALGYRLGGSHVGLLLAAADRRQADAVLKNVQSLTGARDRLLLPPDTTQWVAWLGYGRAIPDTMFDTLCRALRDSGLHTAVGRPRPGVGGFCATHREAVRAEGVRDRLAAPSPCLSFRDVSLEDLLLHDRPLATAFVNDELGALADGGHRAARMRETLSAWLSSGTHTATAARLGIHENTVRLRLNAVADILGAGYLERRAELLVALRLCNALSVARA
ncbi:hypothetical protein HMPREF1211_02687 [Streptomyces sp. HGB0020]|nr:hypothetical protein HMPREF1211_02687 [Streptomyces sp. HGB0020]